MAKAVNQVAKKGKLPKALIFGILGVGLFAVLAATIPVPLNESNAKAGGNAPEIPLEIVPFVLACCAFFLKKK